jgi:hypothetical protein
MTEQPGSSDHPAALVLLVCTTSAPNLHRMNATPTVAAPSASPRAPRSREIGMRQLTGRHSTFLAKLAGVAALIGAADQLMFYDSLPGATLGVFALLWAGVLPILRPDLRGSRTSRIAMVAAAAFGIALVDDPGPLAWVLFWAAIASATLLPRQSFDDAISWGLRLILHGLLGLTTPFRDAARLGSVRRRGDRTSVRGVLSVLALPVIGSGVFIALFASANPLIGNAVAVVRFPDLSTAIGHVVFGFAVLLVVWPSLRPRGTVLRSTRTGSEIGSETGPIGLDVPLATLTLSLLTFNAIFAVENVLDLAFLWSGAPLPEGVTLADYAHRGAYPLIVTALLAGTFVLVASRPGCAGARRPLVRKLRVLWVAQNVLLVASSIRRTLDYIAAYSLTELRIAALAWMALVAVGLVLIVWRMLTARSMRWLVNANALAGTTVLAVASLSDLGAIAAAWNVRHAREAGDLDLCYLNRLGPSALLPMIELEQRAGGPVLRDRARYLRAQTFEALDVAQADWHRWTWRGARRLTAARALLGDHPTAPRLASEERTCEGAPVPPPRPQPAPTPVPPPSPSPASLTKAPRA